MSVEDMAVPFTFNVDGEKVHVAGTGMELQAKFTAPVNPPLGVTVNANVADWP